MNASTAESPNVDATGKARLSSWEVFRGAASPLYERVLENALFGCALISVLTTVGIILVLAFETVEFFRVVAPWRLVWDTEWTPLFAEKHFGIWPLVAGTRSPSTTQHLISQRH